MTMYRVNADDGICLQNTENGFSIFLSKNAQESRKSYGREKEREKILILTYCLPVYSQHLRFQNNGKLIKGLKSTENGFQ